MAEPTLPNMASVQGKMLDWIKARRKKRRASVPLMARFWAQVQLLNVSQWLYFIAFAIVAVFGFEEDENAIQHWVAGTLAGLGLARELAKIFARIWHTSLGKGAIIIGYAAIANIILAVSSQEINIISTVEPSNFLFTLAFVGMLMTPLWIFAATFFILMVMLLVSSVWVFIAMFLRLVRVNVPVHWDDQSFQIITTFLRIGMIMLIVSRIEILFLPYMEQIHYLNSTFKISEKRQMFEDAHESRDEQQFEEKWGLVNNNNVDASDNTKDDFGSVGISVSLGDDSDVKETQESAIDLNPSDGLNSHVDELVANALHDAENQASDDIVNNGVDEAGDESGDKAANKPKKAEVTASASYIDSMIASFIYHLDTYPTSRCKIDESLKQHALSLNDYEVLVVTPDESSPIKYRFEPKPCIPRSGAIIN